MCTFMWCRAKQEEFNTSTQESRNALRNQHSWLWESRTGKVQDWLFNAHEHGLVDNCTWWIRSRKTDRRAREHFYCPQSSRPTPDNVWNKQTVHKRRWVPKVRRFWKKRFYWCQKSVLQSLTIPCLWPAIKLFCTLWTSAEQESTTATPSNSMNWSHLKAVTASALENKFRNESSVLWSWHVVFSSSCFANPSQTTVQLTFSQPV